MASQFEEANRAVVRRYYHEVWTLGRVDVLDDLLADQYLDHDPLPGFVGDRLQAAEMVVSTLGSLPDRRLDVHAVVAEGDLVAAHWTLSWLDSDGATQRMRGHDFYRLEGGRIQEVWHCERLSHPKV